jgi:hypothetical protein
MSEALMPPTVSGILCSSRNFFALEPLLHQRVKDLGDGAPVAGREYGAGLLVHDARQHRLPRALGDTLLAAAGALGAHGFDLPGQLLFELRVRLLLGAGRLGRVVTDRCVDVVLRRGRLLAERAARRLGALFGHAGRALDLSGRRRQRRRLRILAGVGIACGHLRARLILVLPDVPLELFVAHGQSTK